MDSDYPFGIFIVICPGDVWASFKYRMTDLYLLSNIFPISRTLEVMSYWTILFVRYIIG